MSRTAPRLCVAFVVMLTAALGSSADDKSRAKIDAMIVVNAALLKGRDHLQRGEFAEAVAVLEKELGLINGNRDYLMTLRDAYAGLVPQLQAANRLEELKTYQRRLAFLDPAASRGPAPAPAAQTNAPAPSPATQYRGKIIEASHGTEDGTPFAPSNAATNRKSSGSLREQADQAYAKRQFESAAKLFSLAHQESAGSVKDRSEEWAYCRLFVVGQAINRGGNLAAEELRREIGVAASLAPRMQGFADTLLERLKVLEAPAVTVKHTPRVNNGWARAETTNFRIFHAADEADAEKIARIAEATRVSMTRKWFGEEPTDWSPRCDVYVYPTGQGYAKATGAPPTAPGHSTIEQENGRVLKRRIDLRGDDANMMAGVLPHETTHVVLAGRFGSHHVPRWADEGMAVLSEPRERVDMHLRNLPKHKSENVLFGVAELMRLNDYPEARRVGPFYAQSVSLVDFLCNKKDAATFARFLREALDGGYEPALRRHFGYASTADLDREWRQHAFGDGAVVSASDKPAKRN